MSAQETYCENCGWSESRHEGSSSEFTFADCRGDKDFSLNDCPEFVAIELTRGE